MARHASASRSRNSTSNDASNDTSNKRSNRSSSATAVLTRSRRAASNVPPSPPQRGALFVVNSCDEGDEEDGGKQAEMRGRSKDDEKDNDEVAVSYILYSSRNRNFSFLMRNGNQKLGGKGKVISADGIIRTAGDQARRNRSIISPCYSGYHSRSLQITLSSPSQPEFQKPRQSRSRFLQLALPPEKIRNHAALRQ